MKKKTTLKMSALLAIITCAIAAPILVNRYMASAWKLTAEKGSYDPDYMCISGVLSTDNYVLFPFQKKNLTIGFSKWGEMIDYDLKIGMDYGGTTDPWAPNTDYVDEWEWVEGWVINITYWHEDTFYNRWAFALYSDYSGAGGIGGDWIEDVTGGALDTTNTGGRKTNGGAVTDNIRVLYNGPRRFVAFLKTTLYESSSHTYPLVTVTFTIVFDKVKKQAVWFKDIKRIESPKRWGNLQVEFAERGQWDLASNSGETSGSAPKSYANFFTGQSTVYNHSYQSWYTDSPTGYDGTYDVVQIVDDQLDYVAWGAYWPKPIKHWVDDIGSLSNTMIYTTSSTVEQNWTGDAQTDTFTCNLHGGPEQYPRCNSLGSWSEVPMVFVDNNHQTEGVGADFTYSNSTNVITFLAGHIPATGADIRAYYKVDDGNDDVPGTGVEPCSPFTNAEWCFELDDASELFRCVSAFGVTDRNDGDDADHSANLLDNEIQFYLNQTFNPYDLYDTVHKQEYRWVKKDTLTSALAADTNYTLTSGLDDDIFQPNGYSSGIVTASQTWTGYNYTTSDGTFDWVNNYEDGVTSHSKNWMAYLNATADVWCETMLKVTPAGYGVNVTGGQLNFSSIVDFSFWYYALAGSQGGPHIEFELYNSTGTGYVVLGAVNNHYPAGAAHEYVGQWTRYSLNNISDYAGDHYHDGDNVFYIRWCPAADTTDDYGVNIQDYDTYPTDLHSWEWFQERLGSFSVGSIGVSMQNATNLGGECYVDDLGVAYLEKTSGLRYERVYNMEEDKLVPCNWSDYCTFAEKVLINGTLAIPYRANVTNPIFDYYNYTVNFETGNITFATALSADTYLKILYSTIEENEKGRYEWIVVGKGAASIDSIGAAYITEAFDSTKDIPVTLAGMAINDTTFGPHTPFVLGKNNTGTKSDYRDSLNRTYLGDDWCNTTAISSSNMIFAGGPIAQMGTEYFNEFTAAFFASSTYVVNNTGCEEAHSNKILALSCWDRNVSASGYAVVAVHKDLNGTIGLVIWGYDGDDTYYASKWFWDGQGGTAGIEYLQSINRGVTAIMLKITYSSTDPTHPTVSIVERLGTISEKDQHDC